MNWFAWLALVVASQVIHQANARAVFAHFMVTNSENYTVADWEDDMKMAQNAHIDAFALNMAYLDKTNNVSIAMAFTAANSVGFKLLFSFDYAGNGAWDQEVVIQMIQQYGTNGAYFLHEGKPFVSTFEGPNSAADWVMIKAQTGCFFMPDWSSVGAKPAMALANGVADGLFSWAAWPWGNRTMDTYTDASYLQYLDGKPYMFAVSPWFYTNLVGYDKNWIWQGGSLWFDRWQELFALDPMPEFVEIISWNDYGESHYIGPVREKSMAAFDIGQSLFNYALDMPHDGWREMLPFWIDLYKNGKATVSEEKVVFWYLPQPVAACYDAGTTINTASQLQIEFDPKDVLEDRIYVMALLGEGSRAVQVVSGDYAQFVTWDSMPDDEIGAGVYFGSVPLREGDVTIQLVINEDEGLGDTQGLKVSSYSCQGGYNNYNAWVGSFSSLYREPVTTTGLALSDQVCIRGKGAYDFEDLCNFTCSYGYCPVGACTCEQMGVARTKPNATGTTGYPAEGRDANYAGLCSFACNYGHCPSKTCDTTEHVMPIPTVSDFLPPACIAGTGQGNLEGLCSFACGYGYCPRSLCTCTATGPLVQPPAQTKGHGIPALGLNGGNGFTDLCDFTCTRGYCPDEACRYEDEEISTATINPLWSTEPGKTCTDDQKQVILKELEYAIEMAKAAASDLNLGNYHRMFFGEGPTTDATFLRNTVQTYTRVAEILSGNADKLQPVMTCQETDGCKNKNDAQVCSMNAGRKRLNFCQKFFDYPAIKATEDLLEECSTINLRDAARSRSSALVHEATHSKYAMLGERATRDYTYGFNAGYLLPLGKFNRYCAPWAYKLEEGQWRLQREGQELLCPSGVIDPETEEEREGICPPESATKNAESYQHVAAGVYFSRKCGKTIPTPKLPAIPAKRDNPACPVFDDYIIWDMDTSVPVTGYVHFGDSFAAGMGTGTTSSDSCRVGSASYGQLIYNSLDDTDIPFQNLACSGDEISGLRDKLKRWTNIDRTSVVTVTVGGNDVGFADIIKHCILRWQPWSFAPWDNYFCARYKQAAWNLMTDRSDKGLQAQLSQIYRDILAQADSNQQVYLYVAGYPKFFNAQTTYCNRVNFKYWGMDPADPYTALKTNVRQELNELVEGMNKVIQNAIADANNRRGSMDIAYADVDTRFEGHRWCEDGVKEPDATNPSTFFFLSGWSDITEEGAIQQASSDDESDYISSLQGQTTLPLPDGHTCNTTLGTNPDPVNVYWCEVAATVVNDPDGALAQMVSRANSEVADGNYTAQDIGWLKPTRQLKAFHPRSAGMALYRDAILDLMQDD